MEGGPSRNRLAARLSIERAEAEKDRCPALTLALASPSRVTRLLKHRISDIRDIRGISRLRELLVELVLKIAFPTFRQCLDFDRPAQCFCIVSLKSIKTSDIGHADLLLRSAN